jgi:membrane protease YdiL (CAAX protease family)
MTARAGDVAAARSLAPSEAGTTAIFFLLSYAVSWPLWFAAAALSRDAAEHGAGASVAAVALTYLGTFAPGLIALGMTWRAQGSGGVQALLARLFASRVDGRWYVFAVGFMAAVKLVVAVVHRVAYGAWPRFGDTPVFVMLGVTLLSVLVLGQAGEELGWRGFALPRLASRIGLGWGSVVLGVLWAAWHLPLFVALDAADTYHQSFPLYLSQVVALSIAIAWLWWRTNGSLLLTMLFHAAINNTKDIVPSVSAAATNAWTLHASRPGWITVAVLWLFAVAFLADMRRARSVPSSTSGSQ